MNPAIKTKSLLAYLAHKHESPSVTVLMKLSYLVDLVATKKLGQKISDFDYIRYHYGPYDRKINTYLDEMLNEGILAVHQSFKGEIEYFEFECCNDTFEGLSPEEKALIDEVVENLSGYSAKTLTDIAYKTSPMKTLGATLGGTEHLGETLQLK